MPIPFTFRQLEYFLAVAEFGSVTAAAEDRHVSQPSVSVAITELEAVIGQRLFQRQAGHRLTISPAGRRLLVQARTIVASARDIAARNQTDDGRRQLSVACFRDIGPMYLPRLMRLLSRDDPTLGFRLHEGDLADVQAQLLDGRCEIAVTYELGLADHGIAFDEMHRLMPYVMLPKEHRLAARDRVGLPELGAERIVLEDFPVTLDYFLGMFRRQRLDPAEIQKVASFEMQRGLVAGGWGVGLSCVRPWSDTSYDGSPLVCRPLDHAEDSQSIVVAHLGERTLSQAGRRFRDVAMRSTFDAAPARIRQR